MSLLSQVTSSSHNHGANANTNSNTDLNPNANDLEAQRVIVIPPVEARSAPSQSVQKSSAMAAPQYGTMPEDDGAHGAAVPVAAVVTGTLPEPETDYWPLFLGLVVLEAFAMLLYGGSKSWRG